MLWKFIAHFGRAQAAGLLLGMLALCATLAGSGCQSTVPGRGMTDQDMIEPKMVLAPGDAIEVLFPGATNLSGVYRIGPEGSISMPLVGQVQAGGKMASQFQNDLLKLYENELQEKEVIVTVVGSANNVYVMGAVARPGRVQMDRALTALEAVLEAGGFAPNANMKKVRVVRYEADNNVTYNLNLQPIFAGGPVPPFYLRPRDIVYVDEKMQWF